MHELNQALTTSFIDKNINSRDEYKAKLIYNNKDEGIKVAHVLKTNINSCNSFDWSIAFVSDSGLATLKQTLLDLKQKNIKGRLIASDYLNFNSPRTFEQLLHLENIEVRIYPFEGFHPKGYLFHHKNYITAMIGSSNLTQSALATNQEWNLLINSSTNGEIIETIQNEFNKQWQESFPLSQEWIDEYKKIYIKPKAIPNLHKTKLLKPNYMQQCALESLNTIRKENKDRALLISATGTGKTYLSAFDVMVYNPKRMLFVVHRENITRAALKSFNNIMPNKKMGIFTGQQKDYECDYLFSTIQTISKQEYYSKFKTNEFDYIIIDEVHKAGANMYQELMNYFKPKFLLGMSATPERHDNFDIYKMFNYNIAYEIRLQQAMQYDLLCPFHYYGVTDIQIDNIEIDDKSDFNLLTSNIRVEHIIKAINQYGFSGDKVRGLIFCSRKQECIELSKLFNTLGFRTVALTSDDNDNIRRKYMDRLELEECDDALDYILTVDIFNEGIDIPKVNQVIMLRPTQSNIIFIQQLGRGLRKDPSKEYVVVLDFIANYQKNFLIPVALSGSLSYNKDSLRRFIATNYLLPGASTVDFDLISKKKIYESIDIANFNDIKIIKESYNQLKYKLGRIPNLLDFDNYDAIDPLRIFDNKSLGSYYMFLNKYEKSFKISLSTIESKYLEFISKKYASGKRIQELLLLKLLIENNNPLNLFKTYLKEEYNIKLNQYMKTNIIKQLTQNYTTGTAKLTYKDIIFINDDFTISSSFSKLLINKDFKDLLLETINFGIHRYDIEYIDRYHDTDLCLYKKYTYEDVCRLLNWQTSEVALNIGGYKHNKETNTFPVFINYEKREVTDSINYEDHFINSSSLIAISKSKRTIESEDIKTIYNSDKLGIKIHLFVRKNKDDSTSKEFYYLGLIHPYGKPVQFIMKNTNNTAVEIEYHLETAVRNDIYEFITSY